MGFPGGSEVKGSACNAGDPGSILGLGRSPGEGNGTPLQYFCLENPIDGGAWWVTVHGVAKSQTWLNDFTFFQWARFSSWYVVSIDTGHRAQSPLSSPRWRLFCLFPPSLGAGMVFEWDTKPASGWRLETVLFINLSLTLWLPLADLH